MMETSKAINIAIGCVMASYLDNKEKNEVIAALVNLEEKVEE